MVLDPEVTGELMGIVLTVLTGDFRWKAHTSYVLSPESLCSYSSGKCRIDTATETE